MVVKMDGEQKLQDCYVMEIWPLAYEGGDGAV